MGLFDDPQAQGTLSGAGSGALTGAAIGSIIPGVGTGIGAGIGAIGGGLLGFFGGGAEKKRQQANEDARRQLQEYARQQYAQRMQDLDKALAYFQPVNANLQRLYGQGAAIPQQNFSAPTFQQYMGAPRPGTK